MLSQQTDQLANQQIIKQKLLSFLRLFRRNTWIGSIPLADICIYPGGQNRYAAASREDSA